MHTEPIPNRLFNRSTMGTRLFTSAVLPGQSSLRIGSPFQAAETVQNALLDLAVHPDVIDDEQVGSGTVGLRANEQIGAPVSPLFPHS
jgi:hypothetical protein